MTYVEYALLYLPPVLVTLVGIGGAYLNQLSVQREKMRLSADRSGPPPIIASDPSYGR